MKRHGITAGIALGAVALLALTACSPRDGGGGTNGGAPATELVTSLPAATSPVEDVTWAIVEGEPATLDPGSAATLIIPNLCDNLLTITPDFEIEPGVATSAEWTDETTFVIELRDDVTFWDGSAVTADDVAYSLERGLDPESQWYSGFTLVDTIVATGDLEVTVTFVAPDSEFRDVIAGQGGAVMSAAHGENVGAALGTAEGGLMCTGPYQLEEGFWSAGSQIETVANEDYWGGAPLVDTLTYVFVTDTSTLTTALTQGEIDGAFNVAPSSRSAFEGDGAGRLVTGPSTGSYSFGPATDEGPAANPDIRRALSLAIDRDQFIDTVLGGLGEVQKTIVPPFTFQGLETADIYTDAYDALPAPEVDIAAATELVENSGEDLSRPLVIAVPAGATEFRNTAQIIQSAGNEIGLTIEVNEMQPADFGAMFYEDEAREGIDFVATEGYLETPGVLGYPALFMLPEEMGGVFNWSGYDNDEVTAHMDAARTATDPETAAEEFVAAQEVFAADMLQVTLAGTHVLGYVNSDLTGATTSVAIYSSPWALHLGGE